MSLYRRKEASNPKVWYMRYTDAHGVMKRVSTETENKQLADAALNKVKAEVWEQKKLGVKEPMLFSKACETFLGTKEGKSVHEQYTQQLAWWQEKFGSKAMLTDITQARIIDISEAGLKERGWKQATKNRYLAPLRSVMRYAALKRQWVEVQHLPAFFLEKESTGRTRWLKPDEIARLLNALPAHWKDIAGFALATGQRMGNVLGLRWEQVDMARRVVVFEGSVMKNGDEHGIPLNDVSAEIVRRQMGKHLDSVFTYQGKPIKKGGRQTWLLALEKAGLADTGVVKHSLRHTWATMMLHANVSDGVLMALGSWKTPKMVRRYAHANAEAMLHFAQRIDDRLTGAIAGAAQMTADAEAAKASAREAVKKVVNLRGDTFSAQSEKVSLQKESPRLVAVG